MEIFYLGMVKVILPTRTGAGQENGADGGVVREFVKDFGQVMPHAIWTISSFVAASSRRDMCKHL